MNLDADRELAAELDRLGIRRFRVTGGSPDFSHAEPGWGVGADSLETALRIRRRFGQAAIYWVEDDALTPADCATGEAGRIVCWTERAVFGVRCAL